MTDSTTVNRPGKRERLVTSAADLFHREGLERATLARVAEAADVPVGNVYYYFKTRDELIKAVVDQRMQEVAGFLANLEGRSTPRARLRALAGSWADQADLVAGYGCPLGSLANDMAKHDGPLEACVALPLQAIVNWAERQFREMGRRNPHARAVELVGAVEGAAVLANAFRDPKLMRTEVSRIQRSIDAE